MEDAIANSLIQRPDHQAKARMRSGDYDIETNKKPSGLSGSALIVRINQIKARVRKERYCRSYLEVAKEIRDRQDKWKDGGGRGQRPSGPPPARI